MRRTRHLSVSAEELTWLSTRESQMLPHRARPPAAGRERRWSAGRVGCPAAPELNSIKSIVEPRTLVLLHKTAVRRRPADQNIRSTTGNAVAPYRQYQPNLPLTGQQLIQRLAVARQFDRPELRRIFVRQRHGPGCRCYLRSLTLHGCKDWPVVKTIAV